MKNKTNPRISSLIQDLYKLSKKEGVALWKALAENLEKPAGNWAEINMDRLNEITEKGDKVVIPGKVLGSGKMDHKVDVYSFNATKNAKKQIIKAEGSCLDIEDLMKKNPQAKGVKIIK